MTRFSFNDRFGPVPAGARVAGLWNTWLGPQARRIVAFVAACMGLVGAVVLLIWAVSGFVNLRSIGLSGNVLAGLIIGIVVTAGLGAVLMALVFQSDRGGQDEAVYRASDKAPPPKVGPAPTPATRQ